MEIQNNINKEIGMPSLVTHYLFCKHYSPSEDKRELLGSQGPDPLFYYAYTRPFEENGKKIRRG